MMITYLLTYDDDKKQTGLLLAMLHGPIRDNWLESQLRADRPIHSVHSRSHGTHCRPIVNGLTPPAIASPLHPLSSVHQQKPNPHREHHCISFGIFHRLRWYLKSRRLSPPNYCTKNDNSLQIDFLTYVNPTIQVLGRLLEVDLITLERVWNVRQ